MKNYAVSVSVAPLVEPVSLSEAKLHLRVDHDEDDALISSLIVAAREQAEAFTNRAFIEQTLVLTMDEFCDRIKLPKPPFISVTSVVYLDGSGDSQTVSGAVYRIASRFEPALLTLEPGQVWPSTYDVDDAVTITYKAGYGGAASAVPDSVKAAIKMIVESLYENRGDLSQGVTISEIPMTSRALLSPFRVWL